MSGFTLSNKAVADLKDIGRYTQKNWGGEQRDLYLRMLDACFQQIAADPGKGKDCSDICNGYRKLNAGSHVIFYQEQSSGVIVIVRILHGSMDIEARLTES